MGRAKLDMALITNEKSRINTFKKRKQGLIRKIHEFTTLCDVSACMIIYGPDHNSEPETWPADRKEVRRVIDIFQNKKKDSSSSYSKYGLSEYLNDRKRKIEDELSKLRKKNLEAKYPTRHDFIESMPESWLRNFAASLRVKADEVKSRIHFLRLTEQGLIMDSSYNNNNNYTGLMGYSNMVAAPDQTQMQVPNYYPPFDRNTYFQFGGSGGPSTGGSTDFRLGPQEQDGAGGDFYDFKWNWPNPISHYYGGPVQRMDMGPSPGPLTYAPMDPQFMKMEGMNGGAGDEEEGLKMVFNNTSYTGSWCHDF